MTHITYRLKQKKSQKSRLALQANIDSELLSVAKVNIIFLSTKEISDNLQYGWFSLGHNMYHVKLEHSLIVKNKPT